MQDSRVMRWILRLALAAILTGTLTTLVLFLPWTPRHLAYVFRDGGVMLYAAVLLFFFSLYTIGTENIRASPLVQSLPPLICTLIAAAGKLATTGRGICDYFMGTSPDFISLETYHTGAKAQTATEVAAALDIFQFGLWLFLILLLYAQARNAIEPRKT